VVGNPARPLPAKNVVPPVGLQAVPSAAPRPVSRPVPRKVQS
jgi:hypothetical protein